MKYIKGYIDARRNAVHDYENANCQFSHQWSVLLTVDSW